MLSRQQKPKRRSVNRPVRRTKGRTGRPYLLMVGVLALTLTAAHSALDASTNGTMEVTALGIPQPQPRPLPSAQVPEPPPTRRAAPQVLASLSTDHLYTENPFPEPQPRALPAQGLLKSVDLALQGSRNTAESARQTLAMLPPVDILISSMSPQETSAAAIPTPAPRLKEARLPVAERLMEVPVPTPLSRTEQGQPAADFPAPRMITVADKTPEGFRQVAARINPGDTLARLLGRNHIPIKTAMAVLKASRSLLGKVKSLKPGTIIRLTYDAADQLVALDYQVDDGQILQLSREGDDDAFTARLGPQDGAIATQDAGQASGPGETGHAGFDQMFDTAHRTEEESVRNGDNLAGLLARQDVSYHTTMALASASKQTFDLARKMQPGRTFHLAFSKDNRLLGVSYSIASDRTLWLKRTGPHQFQSKIIERQLETRLKTVSNIVNGSLFVAGRKVGLTHQLAVKLASLFEWDVDFARDIRTGDRFTVVMEELMDSGRVVGTGDIIAAEFVNRGKSYRALRYTDPDGNSGYYDPDGNNLQKMFIRAPVDFTRISSLFSMNRKHPVFGFTRAHKGVDYAAPKGTPVRAAGNGRVVFWGRKGGFGNLVLVRHNGKYTTAYAHLDSFSRGLTLGTRVEQGEIIGRVGMTGAATGPHLHYEVRVEGRQVNPLSIQAPSSSISPRLLAHFQKQSKPLLAMLDSSETMVAKLNTPQ
ncbi:MAG: peptidoglycan DD-metalloendopeptidase family protein [Magnetococcales bacterium]|nr:peptidoglycan DD-metalloendopeptidase family protein [Magnetococcales bacterium]